MTPTYSEVRVYSSAGTLLRVLDHATLLARANPVPAQHAPVVAPASPPVYALVAPMAKKKVGRPVRRQVHAA